MAEFLNTQLTLGEVSAGFRREPVALPRDPVPVMSAADRISFAIEQFRANPGTSRYYHERPIAYLYARPELISKPALLHAARVHAKFRAKEQRDGSTQEGVWLRLNGEQSTRRTEAYGDTRARWKTTHWTRPNEPETWALDLRRSPNGRGEIAQSLSRWRTRFELACLMDKDLRRTKHTLLAHSAEALLDVAVGWIPIAIAWALETEPGGGEWMIRIDRMMDRGERLGLDLALATIRPEVLEVLRRFGP
jgi:hypothetical protein